MESDCQSKVFIVSGIKNKLERTSYFIMSAPSKNSSQGETSEFLDHN